MSTPLPQLPSPAVSDIAEKSSETMLWLRENIKVGYTDERGPAWWANGAVTKDGKWDTIPDGSHFPGAIPMEVVLAQLDIPLVKGTVHVTYQDEAGNRQVVADPDTQPIVNARTGQVFSYPTEGYKIHPYAVTLQGFIQQILHDERVGVGSVGLLKKGGVAFLQAVLPEVFEVEGFGYQPYLMAVTSADLSRATSYSTGAKAGVCDNTVNTAITGALTQLKIRHSRFSGVKVEDAREKLGIKLVKVANEIGTAIEALCATPVSEAEFSEWMDLTVPQAPADPKFSTGGPKFTNTKVRRAELNRLWKEDAKVAPWAGTAFGVLQADNTYRTWSRTVKGATRLERNFANDAFGETAKADLRALEVLAQVKDRELVSA
jgi:phage/plasmid-like protein (TIGR03299 family)